MSDILTVFTANILPILIVAGFGYVLRSWFAVEQRSLSAAVLNVFSPALVFDSLVNSTATPSELSRLGLFTVATMGAMGILGLLVSRLLRYSRVETSTLLILVIFVNSGNFGLTLIQLRYGDAGLAQAIVYYVTSTILLYTAGVFIASTGRASWRETLTRMAKLPAVYAAVLAIAFYYWEITIPVPLMSAIEIASAGAIPVMLLVLGMQLADLGGDLNLRLAIPAVSLRLVGGPIVALTIAAVLSLQGVSRSAGIIEASMPSAVFSIILATEFQLPAPEVTSIVVLSTLVSPLTLSVTIGLLGL